MIAKNLLRCMDMATTPYLVINIAKYFLSKISNVQRRYSAEAKKIKYIILSTIYITKYVYI
jgi:hypothetical protein